MIGKILISYDLCKPERDYKSLTDAIQKLGPAQRILESVWIVKTSADPKFVKDTLSPYLDANDKLFVASFVMWNHQHLDPRQARWLLLQ